MHINTYRFGPLEVPDNRIITMKRPVLGFEGMHGFCLIEHSEMLPFLVLQSTEDPALAFIVVNPVFICPDYRIEINPKEIAELDVQDLKSVETYAIVTVPEEAERISVNLQGPLLINTENNYAKQLVLVNSQYRVHHYVIEELEAIRTNSDTTTRTELVGA